MKVKVNSSEQTLSNINPNYFQKRDEKQMSPLMIFSGKDIETPEKRGKYTVSVVGCGRMGLSTACLFAEAGFKVIGVDADQHAVNIIKRGKAPFFEPGLDEILRKHVKDGRLIATNEAKDAASASDVIVFVVPTLIDEKKKPVYLHVEKACKDVGMGMRSGAIIIFESTVGPGITETLVKDALEGASGLKAGTDFALAYSPIHATAGRVLEDISSRPRVVGAVNEQSLEAACLVLSTVTKGEIIKVRNMKTAEAVKLFENVYCDVNLALTNELARFCEKAGIDFIEAMEAANTHTPCCLLHPGMVGGPILKDPYLLVDEAENVNARLRLTALARKINDEMLGHVLRLARDALRQCGKTLLRATVSVLGVSYRPNVKESQGSSTAELVNMLRRRGAKVRVYDPFFSFEELRELGYPAEGTLTRTIEGTDCLIIAVGHEKFQKLNLEKIKFLVKKPAAIVDMGRVVNPENAEKEGFVYRGVGRGLWKQ
jgi:UDP-N-acetyl-D-mannosaminuronic acid dehydrogenase